MRSPPSVKLTLWRTTLGLTVLAGASLTGAVLWSSDPEYRWAQIRRMDSLHTHDATVIEVAAQAKLDPALVKAIAWQESRLDPRAQSPADARGLMQVGAGTALEWAAAHQIESFLLTDLFDPRTNLQAGTWYLRQALDRWRDTDDPIVFALADYSAGPELVRRWSASGHSAAALLQAIDRSETRRFVEEVRARSGRFREHGL